MSYMFYLSISYVNILPILYTGQPFSLFVVILPLIGNTTLIFFLGPGCIYGEDSVNYSESSIE